MAWNRSDVDRSKGYQVALCQLASGSRYFVLHEKGGLDLPVGCCFLTGLVPTDLLLRRDFEAISTAVPLASGDRFYVDAHGVWLTRQEEEAWEAGIEVPWHNGIRPRFAPK